MAELLLDVNLQQVPDQYLVGAWRVVDRALSQASPHTPLAQATTLVLHDDYLRVDTTTAAENGRWAVVRDSLLSRPYLQLQLVNEEASALITRLRRSPDGQHRTLTLYFQSGMELYLVQP